MATFGYAPRAGSNVALLIDNLDVKKRYNTVSKASKILERYNTMYLLGLTKYLLNCDYALPADLHEREVSILRLVHRFIEDYITRKDFAGHTHLAMNYKNA